MRIDNDFLQELGLGDLPMEEKELLVEQIRERLELRVGGRLTDRMTEEQKEEFDTNYVQQEDESGAMKWLEKNFPNYPDIVKEELENLKQELKEQSGTIRDIIRQQQEQQQQPQQTPQSEQE